MKCPECWKPKNLCLCEDLDPVASRLRVLVLQHPQEARNPRSTARLVSLVLPNAVHRVGLSWKSLATALGAVATPSEWGILYVGQAKEAERLPKNESVHVLSKKKRLRDLKGIVVLDGNWKQSKTLWWRNPWMLRLHRMILTLPEKKSRFVSRQPRKSCICTLEAVSEILKAYGDKPATFGELDKTFDLFVERLQAPRGVPVAIPASPLTEAPRESV
ncbi:MAG: DTW domain-containing protein [Bdellovibrionaceae bacterium]|nr:DTW domain-containing protein [Pseudobdellovibrionaceae bacterium]